MSLIEKTKWARRCPLVVWTMALAAAMSGCTIMPGLNVDSAPAFGAGYEVAPDPSGIGSRVSDPKSGFSYRVVELNAKNIGALAHQASEHPIPTQLGSITPGVVPDEYTLGAGDIVSVIVWDHPELTNATGEFRDPVTSGRLVSTSGDLFYPYVGTIKVAGLTVAEARKRIADGLSKVIKDPQVDIRVVAFRARRVQVTGAVNSPGIVNLDDTPKGVLEAIAERGGISEIASRRRIELIRGGKTYNLDEADVVAGHSPILNPPLLPGDIINIPDKSADQVFVLGSVGLQGPVYLQQTNTTLTEALAESKGLDALRADDSGVLVFRQGAGDKEPTVFALNMASPVGLLLAGEFQLEARDVVYVKATDFAKYNAVISQLLPTITAIYELDRL